MKIQRKEITTLHNAIQIWLQQRIQDTDVSKPSNLFMRIHILSTDMYEKGNSEMWISMNYFLTKPERTYLSGEFLEKVTAIPF